MKKITITLIIVPLLYLAGCSTVPEQESAPAEDKAQPEAAVQEQKEPVYKKVKVPHLTRETSFYSDGFVENYRVYTYADNMEIVREDLFDSFDEIIESVVYEKTSASEMKVSLYNSRGELQSYRINSYDSAGYLVRAESWSNANSMQTVSEYSYDEMGRKTAWRVADSDEVVLSETKYVYEDDNCVRIEIYDSAENLVEHFENKYENDLLIRQTHYKGGNKKVGSVEYVYENDAAVTEKHLRANGSVSRTVKYENDPEGSPVKAEYYDGNGKLKDWLELEYEYVIEEIAVTE